MKKCVLKIVVFALLFVLVSCKGQSVKVNGNGISLKQNNHTLDELVFDSFELKENKKDGNIIIVDYEFKDDPNEVGLPKFPTYKGELYITVDGEKIKPILNIVHELQQLSGPRIKLLNCSKDNNYLNLEYDVQLYEQRPAAFGTVNISYKLTGNDTEGYEYTVIDYKSDLSSHFKRADDEDPTMMIPSMEGDVIRQVDLSFEEFEDIANQVLGNKKADNPQEE